MSKKLALLLLFILMIVSIVFAVISFDKQKRINRDFESFKFNGIFEYNNRHFANAVQQFVNASYLKPKDVEVRLLIVQAYKRSKSYNLAEDFIKDSLKILPSNSILLTELGYVYLGWGKLEEAKAIFQKLVDSEADSLEGYDGLAEVEFKKRNYNQAIKNFNYTLPYVNKLIEKKMEKHKVASHFFRYAIFLMKTGHSGEALSIFQRCTKLMSNSELYFYMAQLYEYMNKKPEAEKYYTTFLNIAGNLYQEEIEFAKQRIEALKRDEFLPPPPVVPLK